LSHSWERAGRTDQPVPLRQNQEQRLQYEQWVRLYAPELYRFAYRLSGQKHVAEDLLQETFVEAWRSIGKQKYADKARAWLFQILRYRYTHFLRDNRHHHKTGALPQQFGHPSDMSLHPLQQMAERDALQAALETLSDAVRQTFLMVFAEGLTCRETAAELGIPLGTVLSRVDAARRALRERLQEPQKQGGNAL
jgi:RNA polymerase sigma-70 factor (ECF subfamily)